MFNQALLECLERAVARLTDACGDDSASAQALREWTTRLSPTGRSVDYFDGGRAVMFLLPWWLEKRVRQVPDAQFQQLLVESTVSAYYFVRLIDNVMDGHAPHERELLPLLGVLHTNLSRPYTRLFLPSDPFWEDFDRYWSGTADAAIREKSLTEISSKDFVEIVARKTSGIKIPLAAVCRRYDRPDLFESWSAFYDKFSCWQQMSDDVFDWLTDLRLGNVTFFLSEGHRQKRSNESVMGWAVRRGFAWSLAQLDAMMCEARAHAMQLESPELVRFLDYRQAELAEFVRDLRTQLEQVARIANVFEPVDEASSLSEGAASRS